MFARGLSIFNRRLSVYSRVSSSSASYSFNLSGYNGHHRYSSNCGKQLLKSFVCTQTLGQYEFQSVSSTYTTSKRYKQTPSNEEKTSSDVSDKIEEPPEKLSVFKRYKKMLKEYWYVLLPVHCVTSVFWFGGFYYAAKCGIDIVPFLEYINIPEKFIEPLRSSALGHIAVASAFYKVATPARYMVTLGGTTVAVKFLTKRGLIRPVPTKSELKTIIQNHLKKETKEKQT